MTKAVTLGPAIALIAFVQQAVQALTSLRGESIVPLALLLVAIAYCLHRSRLFCSKPVQTEHQLESPDSSDSNACLKTLTRWSVIGYITLTLGYVLTLSGANADAVFQVQERQSLVHVAAVFGAAIICGCVAV
ncbi:MAG: hypothetical protein HC895_20170 [Leptolyngbyaceae cyanobacterium SM1_3_5]|nr:hypothetical protein [Leptolyngbyaceae cyanobacterium SM1_3_5]